MLKSLFLLVLCLIAPHALAQNLSPATPVTDSPPLPAEQPAAADELKAIIEKFKADTTRTREYPLGKVSEAYAEDSSNPALRLERMWSNESGTLLELLGLNRKGKKVSAIIDVDSLYLQALVSGQRYKYLLHLGGTLAEGGNERKLLQILPGEHLYLFFEAIDDYQSHSLRYTNWAGQPDSYFDVIDPRFRERYDSSYAKADSGSVEEMRRFLQEFARNDPDARAQKVFVSMIKTLRAQNTFDGHYQAFQLVRDPADEKAAGRLARSEEQQAKLRAAVEVARQAELLKREEIRKAQEIRAAELKKREEARLAELRKQDELRQAELKREQARADEERCMRNPSCRQAWAAEQAKCQQQIMHCRQQCDTVTGAGSYSGFFAGLTASFMARTCYGACKCNNGVGAVLGKFNSMVADSRSSGASPGRASEGTGARAGETSGQAQGKTSAMAANGDSGPRKFECKVYCKSANGPVTYKTVMAGSRREAAKMVGDSADEVCASAGKDYASRIALPESQCYPK